MHDEKISLEAAVALFQTAIEDLGPAPGYIDDQSFRYAVARSAASMVLGLPIENVARWPQPSACSKVVALDRAGRCLLGKRADFLENGGTWSFPAGFLNPGETPEEAARRELFEEAGIVVPKLRDIPDAIRSFWYSDKTTFRRWVIESTWCVVLDGVEAAPSSEMTEWKWTEPRTLQAMLANGEIAEIEKDAVGFAISRSRRVAPHLWLGVGLDEMDWFDQR